MAVAKLKTVGTFKLKCFDRFGKLKWEAKATNGVTTQGMNYILDTGFAGGTAKDPWYIGLIDDTAPQTLAAADVIDAHAGWVEDTNYAGNRKEWTEGAAAAGIMTNAVTVDFTMNAATTLIGAFLTSVNTGGASPGDLLFCTAFFDGGDQAVVNTDVIQATYTITASDQTA